MKVVDDVIDEVDDDTDVDLTLLIFCVIVFFFVLGVITCLRWLVVLVLGSRARAVRYASVGVVTAAVLFRWRNLVHKLFRIRRLQRLFAFLGHHLQNVLPVPSSVRLQLRSGF